MFSTVNYSSFYFIFSFFALIFVYIHGYHALHAELRLMNAHAALDNC